MKSKPVGIVTDDFYKMHLIPLTRRREGFINPYKEGVDPFTPAIKEPSVEMMESRGFIFELWVKFGTQEIQ